MISETRLGDRLHQRIDFVEVQPIAAPAISRERSRAKPDHAHRKRAGGLEHLPGQADPGLARVVGRQQMTQIGGPHHLQAVDDGSVAQLANGSAVILVVFHPQCAIKIPRQQYGRFSLSPRPIRDVNQKQNAGTQSGQPRHEREPGTDSIPRAGLSRGCREARPAQKRKLIGFSYVAGKR